MVLKDQQITQQYIAKEPGVFQRCINAVIPYELQIINVSAHQVPLTLKAWSLSSIS